MSGKKAEYELYYWPSIPGRGEFVRLALEDAGASYRDVARAPKDEGGGVPAMMRFLKGQAEGVTPLAPPFLVHGHVVLAQTSAILAYLGPRLGLVPEDEASRFAAMQHELTIADLVAEAHDVHHPIGVALYYEDQKREALRRAKEFRGDRIAKYLGYFERALEKNTDGGGRCLVGSGTTYPDLALFQVIEGLRHAFPKAMKRHERSFRHVVGVRDGVAARPRIAAYLASPRRIPFGDGIFRDYPELDGD